MDVKDITFVTHKQLFYGNRSYVPFLNDKNYVYQKQKLIVIWSAQTHKSLSIRCRVTLVRTPWEVVSRWKHVSMTTYSVEINNSVE